MLKSKTGYVTVATLLTVVGVLALACGCQESKERKAGKEIRQAVENAQRIYDTAQNMLARPMYVNTDKNELLPGDPAAAAPEDPLLRDIPKDDAQARKEAEAKAEKIWNAIIALQTTTLDSGEQNSKNSAPGAYTLKDIIEPGYVGPWNNNKSKWDQLNNVWEPAVVEDILKNGAYLTIVDKLFDTGFIKEAEYFKLRQELTKLAVPSVLPTTLPAKQELNLDENTKALIAPYIRNAITPQGMEVGDRSVAGGGNAPSGGATTHTLSLSPMDPCVVVDPNVPAKLKEAETILTKTIEENKDNAVKSDMILAYLMRAKIRGLLGYYYYLSAKPYSKAVESAIMRGQWVASLIWIDSNRKPYFETLRDFKSDADKLSEDLTENEKIVKDSTDKKSKIETEISDTKKKISDLNNRIATLNQEIMDLKALSARQHGEESIATYDKTEPKNQEIKESYSKIGELEINLIKLEGDKKNNEIVLDVASKKLDADKKMVEEQAALKKQYETQLKELDDRIKIWGDLLGQISSEISDMTGLAKKAMVESKKAYDLAQTDLVKADTDCTPLDKTTVQAQLGDLRMSMGEQAVRGIQVAEQIRKFMELVRPVCEAAKAMPASVASLGECCKEDEMKILREDASKSFDGAATNFKAAADNLDKKLDSIDKDTAKGFEAKDLKWAYQGRMADAYVMLMTVEPNNSDCRKKAEDNLKDALNGKESSPLLINIRRLQDMLQAKK